jgi:hypothetical protein
MAERKADSELVIGGQYEPAVAGMVEFPRGNSEAARAGCEVGGIADCVSCCLAA